MTATQSAYEDSKRQTEVLAEVVGLSEQDNRIIFAFLIIDSPKTFSISKKAFESHRSGRDARSCCYYLVRKYSTIKLATIADRFETDRANIKRRIESVEEAIKTKKTFEQLLSKLETLEKNLIAYIAEKKLNCNATTA